MSKKAWQKKEKSDSKFFGAKPTPRSGGLWFAKGDVKNETFLIDSKDSKHNSFTITKKMWDKVYREAIVNGRLPMLSIKFGDKETELVVLDKNDFLTVVK